MTHDVDTWLGSVGETPRQNSPSVENSMLAAGGSSWIAG